MDNYEKSVMHFLSTNTFIPHELGNIHKYGLNFFGCDSIIHYNNDIWKFLYFMQNSNNAVYINKNGKKFIYNDDHEYNEPNVITRMMIVE